MSLQALLLGMGGYLVCDSADFDSTVVTNYIYRTGAPVGITAGKRGLFSAWLRIDGVSGSGLTLVNAKSGASSRLLINRNAANQIALAAAAVDGTNVVTIASTATFGSGAPWYHILASWDTAQVSGAQLMYINSSSSYVGARITDVNIHYAVDSWAAGSRIEGTDKLDGCLAELWFHTTYMDISNPANRAKFITPQGKPAFLGSDGAAPLGAQPLVYIRVARGAAPATFATNLGTGGNFAVSGVLTTGSTSPG